MKKIILIILVSSAWLTTAGQFEKIIQPTDLKQQTIVTEPITLRKGFFRTGVTVNYTVQDKYFDEKGKRIYRPSSLWGRYYSFYFGLQYGITDRLEADIYVPLVNNRLEGSSVIMVPVLNMDVSQSAKLKSKGLGDCIFRFYYQVIPEKVRKYSFTVFGDFTFPTGSKNYTEIKDMLNFNPPLGEGIFQAGVGMVTKFIVYPYSFSANAIYYYGFPGTKLNSPTDLTETRFKVGNRIYLNGSVNVHLNEWIALANEFDFFYQGKGEIKYSVTRFQDPCWDIAYLPRLVFQVRRFRISEFVMVPLFGKNMDADPRYSLSVSYTF